MLTKYISLANLHSIVIYLQIIWSIDHSCITFPFSISDFTHFVLLFKYVYCVLMFIQIILLVILLLSLTDEEEQRSIYFLDLMKIPGCALIFAQCTILTVTSSARITGIATWLQVQVNHAFDVLLVIFM